MKIGFVCTNYNNSRYTEEAVRSLLADSAHEYHIVVVDNSSRAESVHELELVARSHPAVDLILNRENLGYFRGLNLGIRHLRERHPDIEWMVIGNNDLEFPAGFGSALSANAARWRMHAVVSPDVITIDGVHQNPHVISKIGAVREIFYDLYYSNYYLGMLILRLAMTFRSFSDRPDETQWQIAQSIYQGHGSCYLLGPRFFEQFSELWAPTKLMSEEFFLSKQLSDAGQQVYYEPAIQVVHHCHGALGRLPRKEQWALARAAHREYRKYVNAFGKNRNQHI